HFALKLPGVLAVVAAPHFAELSFDNALFAFEVHALLVVITVFGARNDLANDGLNGRLGGAGEYSVQRIVIFGGNGVELVIVAASAGDCQAQETFGDDI